MANLLERLVEEDFGFDNGAGVWGRSEQHNSLVVNSETQTWFWNSRGIKGNIFDYLILVRGMEKEQAKIFLKNSFGGFNENREEIVKSNPYDKLVDIMWENGKTHREYWYKRCLTDDTIDRYKLGFYNGAFLIPLYEDGEFVNFQCRMDEPEKRIWKWYKNGNTSIYNAGILPFTKTVYITEGLVDAILLNQEGFPAIASYGVNSWKDDWFTLFSKIQTIYYLEDNDDAGRVGAKRVAYSLGQNRVRIVSFTGRKEKYDTGDFFKEGGTKQTFREYVENNNKYIFELEAANGLKGFQTKKKGFGSRTTGNFISKDKLFLGRN